MQVAVDQVAPPVTRVTDATRSRRAIAIAVACAAGGLLGIASALAPDSQGLGTHQQLNLPQCGWITLMEVPCVTCGMTTAFSHTVRGSFLQAMLAQPMGFVLAMATAMTLLISLYVALTGSPVTRMFTRLWTPRLLWVLAAMTAASWVFKIAMYRGMIA